jgi:hypothetical protein
VLERAVALGDVQRAGCVRALPGGRLVALEGPMMAPHGTASRYSHHGCRCDECRVAASLRINKWRRERALGITRMVEADATRDHLRWLSDCGIGQVAVEVASGVSRSQVVKIKLGQVKRVRIETERRILAVSLADGKPGAPVRNPAVFRMVEELKAQGWSERELARRIGLCGQSGLQLNRRTQRVTSAKAQRIEALYRELMAPLVGRREFDAARQADYRARKAAGNVNGRAA